LRRYFAILVTHFTRASPATDFNAAARDKILTSIEDAIGQYFFTERIPKLPAMIEAHWAAYLQIADPQSLPRPCQQSVCGGAR